MFPDASTLLLQARTRAGLSRRTLAKKVGVPISTVSRIETGQIDPTLSMLRRLVDASGHPLVVELAPNQGRPTIAALATALDPDAKRLKVDWTRLRAFADWADQNQEELAEAVADPPMRTDTPLDAILAAFAEQLAYEHGIERPRWTRAVGPLGQQWSPPSTPRMRDAAAATTPEPFRRRNLILARSALFRSEAAA